MHRATFTAFAAVPAGGLGAPESPPAETDEAPAVLAPPVVAVDVEEPPQPASNSAPVAAITAAASPPRFPYRDEARAPWHICSVDFTF
jgi:hypothetical protein